MSYILSAGWHNWPNMVLVLATALIVFVLAGRPGVVHRDWRLTLDLHCGPLIFYKFRHDLLHDPLHPPYQEYGEEALVPINMSEDKCLFHKGPSSKVHSPCWGHVYWYGSEECMHASIRVWYVFLGGPYSLILFFFFLLVLPLIPYQKPAGNFFCYKIRHRDKKNYYFANVYK